MRVSTLAFALAGLCRLAFSLEPDKQLSVLDAAAGSAALASRLDHPWNSFLLDGENTFTVGDLFYAERRFSSAERFSVMPQFQIEPRLLNGDSSRAAASLDAGGEGSRSPAFFNSGVGTQVNSYSRIALEGDQDGLYSHRMFARRDTVLGGRAAANLSYLGHDLPPLSIWRAGGQLSLRGGVFEVSHASGFAWESSRLTGETYPLKVQGTEINVGTEDGLRMHFSDFRYAGASDSAAFSPPGATLSEVGFSASGGEEDSWNWGLEWVYRHRSVEHGSSWEKMNRSSYPWAFRGGRGWKGGDAPWKTSVKMALEYDESVLLSRISFNAEEPLRKNVFTQELRAYIRRCFDDSAFIAESLPGAGEPASGYQIPGNARGSAITLGYAFRDSMWQAGVAGSGSVEWEAPVFEGAILQPPGQSDVFRSRYGIYTSRDVPLERWQASSSAETRIGSHLRLRMVLGWQMFTGREADSLEFSPAPYYGEIGSNLLLPQGLRAEARVQGVGPKRYHGFGTSLRIPPHFENSLGLEQPMFAGRLRARLAVFRAFGDGLLEHPLGNPLGLEIQGGITCALR